MGISMLIVTTTQTVVGLAVTGDMIEAAFHKRTSTYANEFDLIKEISKIDLLLPSFI